jgi:hypothetical protein
MSLCCIIVLLQEIMKRADTDSNAVIDLNEFIKYMLSHERKLYLAFTSLDKNSDGKWFILTLFKNSLSFLDLFSASCLLQMKCDIHWCLASDNNGHLMIFSLNSPCIWNVFT